MSSSAASADRFLARAQVSDDRALAEERRAQRAQELAESGPAVLRTLHLSMAEAHRTSAERHRVVAQLHHSLALRLRVSSAGSEWTGSVFADLVSDALAAQNAAAILRGPDGSILESQGTEGLGAVAQDLELIFDEGPLRSACATSVKVMESGPSWGQRWSGFGPAAAEAGLRSVFAAPIGLADRTIGAVAVYNSAAPSKPTAPLKALAEVLATLVSVADVGVPSQQDGSAWDPVGQMTEIHQAVGRVAAANGCDRADAMSLIQAHAYATAQSMAVVARRIVQGDLVITL